MSSKLRFLFLLILLPSTSFALTDKYVITDCANNGDGTADSCAASAGAAGAWKSLAQSVTGLAGTLTDSTIVHLRGTTAETAAVTISGITTNANTLEFEGDWDGVSNYSESNYRIINNPYYAVVTINNPNTTLRRIQIVSQTTTANGGGRGIRLGTSATGTIKIESSLVRFDTTYANTDGGNNGIEKNIATGGVKLILANNFIYGFRRNGVYINDSNNDNIIAYNNTISDIGNSCINLAAYGTTDAAYLINNLMSCSGNDYALESSFATYQHFKNITSDATSPDTAYRSKTIGFVDAANGNYHLAATDTEAINQGDDLSGISPSTETEYPFDTDIDGQTRTGTWDIGADEYQSSVNYKLLLLRNELEY